MFQLICIIILGLLCVATSIYSYRRAQTVYGVSDNLYTMWWWLSLCSAICVLCMAISAGTVLQRMYS